MYIKAIIGAVILHLLHVPTTAIYILATVVIILAIIQVALFKAFERILDFEDAPRDYKKILDRWMADEIRKRIFSHIMALPILIVLSIPFIGIDMITSLLSIGLFIANVRHIAHVSDNYSDDIKKLREEV